MGNRKTDQENNLEKQVKRGSSLLKALDLIFVPSSFIRHARTHGADFGFGDAIYFEGIRLAAYGVCALAVYKMYSACYAN